MNTVNLQISIPQDLYYIFQKQNSEKNLSDFVTEALKNKIQNKKDTFHELLKEGYMASLKEDMQIMNDFSASDYENLD